MSGFALILARDLRDLTRGTAFRIVVIALLALAGLLAAGAALVAPPSAAAGHPGANGPSVPLPIGTMLYASSLLPFVVFVWVFAGAILIGQRASGQLETLLATPLSARSLWLGKTAAIVLPGLLVAALSSGLILSAVVAAGGASADRVPAGLLPLLVVCWLGNPLLFAGLGALTILLALRFSPDVAIVPSFALGFGLMVAVPAATVARVLDLSSWAFASSYVAAGGVEWILVSMLASGLTKERIVLSATQD